MKLNEILNINEIDYKKHKIHLACGGDPKDRLEAYRKYKNGKFKKWQEGQNAHNFQRDYIGKIVCFHRSFRSSYLKAENYIETFISVE